MQLNSEIPVKIKIQPPEGDPLYKKAVECVKILKKNNYDAYFAGGCVRDILLAMPSKDYDIATNAKPEEIMKLFKKIILVGASFGVVRARFKGSEFEIATFRKDDRYIDGRHPQTVYYSTIIEDVKRRDFTINGLFYSPISCEVIDYVGGIKDIKNKLIKTIGNPKERFAEDKLRMIRAIRFSSTLGFRIDKETFKAIKEESEKITEVSYERIRDEFVKIFESKNPDIGLCLLEESGILKKILPEIFANEEKLPLSIKEMFNIWEGENKLIGFAILTSELEEEEKLKIFERLALSNKEKKTILKIDKISKILQRMKIEDIAEQKRIAREKFIKEGLTLYEIKLIQKAEKRNFYEFFEQKLKEWKKEEIFPPKILDGNELKKIGIPQGPIYKKILKTVEDEQLRGNIKTYEEAIEFIRRTNW